MLEIGETLKIFSPSNGTKIITVIDVRKWSYGADAKDFLGNIYEYVNEWKWIGPKGDVYYVLDNENKIKDPKCLYMKEE